MTGKEFRDIRRSVGLKKPDWMYALGYQGNKNTLYLNCERYEKGERAIPLYLAQYVWLIHEIAHDRDIALDENGLPEWPKWPLYEHVEVSP
jgi:hypothetical protein